MKTILFLLLVSAQFLNAQNLNDGLIAHYPFNGNANDESGNGNHGTNFGTERYVDGIYEDARQFTINGSGNEYLNIPNNIGLNEYAISFWVKFTDLSNHNSILALNSVSDWTKSDLWIYTSAQRIAVIQNKQDLRTENYGHIGNYPKSENFLSSDTLTNNTYYNVTINYKDSTLTIYLNNEFYVEYENVDPIPNNSGTGYIGITPHNNGLLYQLDGDIDELRIYNRILTGNEIHELFAYSVCNQIVYDTIQVFDTITTYVSSDQPLDGLVAYYPFNGNANDESGNGNNGIVNGAILTSDRFGNAYSAYMFDGVDDYIKVPDHQSLDVENLTISLWIKPNEFKFFNNGYSDYSKYSGPITKTTLDAYNQSGFSTTSNDKSLRFSAIFEGGSSSQPGINGDIGIDEWIHIVYVFENGTIRIFKNSELLLENSDYSNKKLSSNNEPMFIGKTFWFPNYSLLTSYFSGCIDDIKVYNKALSSCEIAICFNEGKCYETVYDTITTYVSSDQPLDGLVAYYRFYGNANDESGNANKGEVYGATLTADRFGNENCAYAFNGIDDYIQLPSDYDMQERTVSVWFKSTQIKSTQRIYYSDHNELEYGSTTIDLVNNIEQGFNTLRLICGGGQAEILTYTIEQNEWYNAILTIDSKIVKAYINGSLIGETSFVNHHSVDGYSNSFIGCNRKRNNYFFGGRIDDIRIYNKVLSPAEVKTLYYEGMSLEEILSDNNVVDTITYIDTTYVNDTLTYYDTIKTYISDTIFTYDSISVTDTLIIDVLFLDVDPQDISSIKVYPNPTKDKLQILIDDKVLNQEYNIKIVTDAGILVFESNGLNLKNYEIDMKQFGKEGLYFIQILNENNVIIDSRKIILE